MGWLYLAGNSLIVAGIRQQVTLVTRQPAVSSVVVVMPSSVEPAARGLPTCPHTVAE